MKATGNSLTRILIAMATALLVGVFFPVALYAEHWTEFQATNSPSIQYRYCFDARPYPLIQFRNTSDHDASFSYRARIKGEDRPSAGNAFVKANDVGAKTTYQITRGNQDPQVTSVEVTLK